MVSRFKPADLHVTTGASSRGPWGSGGGRAWIDYSGVWEPPRQARIGEFVRRIGEGRPVAACELVLALGAGLDPAQSARKRKVDRLIVARLEMQAVMMFGGAPIAPV